MVVIDCVIIGVVDRDKSRRILHVYQIILIRAVVYRDVVPAVVLVIVEIVLGVFVLREIVIIVIVCGVIIIPGLEIGAVTVLIRDIVGRVLIQEVRQLMQAAVFALPPVLLITPLLHAYQSCYFTHCLAPPFLVFSLLESLHTLGLPRRCYAYSRKSPTRISGPLLCLGFLVCPKPAISAGLVQPLLTKLCITIRCWLYREKFFLTTII